jgi:hypothetical protein
MTTREEFITGLRQLAEALERDETLPVPFHTRLQSGFYGTGEGGAYQKYARTEKLALLRAFAETLGVDVVEDRDGARHASRMFGPIEYFAYVNAEKPHEPDAKRIVPADEDAALMAVTSR